MHRLERNTVRVASATVLTLLCASFAAGCGGDTDPPPESMSGPTVQPADITAQAERLIGPKMPEGSTLECPDPLSAQVDATTTCSWAMPDGTSIGMTVTVTEITDGKASLNFANDDQVTPSPSS
ncbi:hypothetical protein [Janibacter anophelis]|uniref:hypothetical protein n=1 Tax=Janibacter anophelis TaxID=319054 RepID=UPI003F806295